MVGRINGSVAEAQQKSIGHICVPWFAAYGLPTYVGTVESESIQLHSSGA